MHLLVLSKGVWVSLIVLLKALKLFIRLSHGLHIKLALWKGPAVNFLRSCEQRCIIHRKQIIGVRDISYRLVKPTATRFYVTRSCLNLFWCPNILTFRIKLPHGVFYCDTNQMCYFLGKYSPFPGGLTMAKLLTWQPLPICYLLSSPRFWETRDQRFPGSLSLSCSGGRVGENPGNEVGSSSPSFWITSNIVKFCNFRQNRWFSSFSSGSSCPLLLDHL